MTELETKISRRSRPGQEQPTPKANDDGMGLTEKDALNAVARTSTTKFRNAKVKQADLILFTTQLSVMLDSGVVLSEALDAIESQLEPCAFKIVIMEITETVKRGENFSQALSEYPKIFSAMFISMVRASEASGRMVEMLRVLSGYLGFEFETRKRVKGALTYPAIMMLMALVSTSILVVFVLPRFTKIYEAKGAALPQLTQTLVNFSKLISDPESMTIMMTTLMSIVFGIYFWLGTEKGRRVMDYIKIHTPVLGTMFVDMVITRSMRIMSTMVNTGVSLLDTIDVMEGACNNYYFSRLWKSTDKKIRDGYQLSESIQISPDSKLISPGVIQMLCAGEKSGRLGEVSDKISTFYEKKFESSIKSVTALIEPLMLIVLGSIIGTIAIALLLPVFKISTIVAH